MPPSDSAPQLSDPAAAIVDLCVRVAQFIGLPKSVGEIYGLLFISPDPLCLDHCVERLGLSQGSASQGLRELRQIRAVKTVYVPGDRRDFYLPETGLGTLAQGFLAHRILPALDDLATRVDAVESTLDHSTSSDTSFLAKRLAKIKSWLKQATRGFRRMERFRRFSA